MWGVRGGRDGLLYVGKAERRLRGRGLWTLFNVASSTASTDSHTRLAWMSSAL